MAFHCPMFQFSDTAFHPDHVLERDFLGKCIASHLMTFGRSLVIGETADRINLVISFMFMSLQLISIGRVVI